MHLQVQKKEHIKNDTYVRLNIPLKVIEISASTISSFVFSYRMISLGWRDSNDIWFGQRKESLVAVYQCLISIILTMMFKDSVLSQYSRLLLFPQPILLFYQRIL